MNFHKRVMYIPCDDQQDSIPLDSLAAYRHGHKDARYAAAELANYADAELEQMHTALQLCLEHFEREICGEATMIDSDFGEAYRACLAILRPNKK